LVTPSVIRAKSKGLLFFGRESEKFTVLSLNFALASFSADGCDSFLFQLKTTKYRTLFSQISTFSDVLATCKAFVTIKEQNVSTVFSAMNWTYINFSIVIQIYTNVSIKMQPYTILYFVNRPHATTKSWKFLQNLGLKYI